MLLHQDYYQNLDLKSKAFGLEKKEKEPKGMQNKPIERGSGVMHLVLCLNLSVLLHLPPPYVQHNI